MYANRNEKIKKNGCSQFKENFCQSSILAIACVILTIATLVNVVCSMLPWWFILKFDFKDGTFGTEPAMQQSIDTGIFFMYKPDKPGLDSRIPVLMTSLLAMEKAGNIFAIPRLFKAGQVFFSMGLFGIIGCTGSAYILAAKRLGSLTGSMALAAFTLACAICNVLGILLLLFTSLGMDGTNEWNLMPLEKPFHHLVLNAHPAVELNWSFYIACIGAALALVAALLIWMQTITLCRSIEDIRQRQQVTEPLKEPYPEDVLAFSYDKVKRPAVAVNPPGHGGYIFVAAPQMAYRPAPATQMEYRSPPATQMEYRSPPPTQIEYRSPPAEEAEFRYRVPPSPQSSVASEVSGGYKLRQVEI